MKTHVIITILIVISSHSAFAQVQPQTQTDSLKTQTIEKKSVNWSAAWGLFGNVPKEKRKGFDFQFDTSGFKDAFVPLETQIDTSKYVVKSYLWGSIKWTEKKKANE
jgi:hypothetical protein